jgi:cytidylate kinase
MSFIVAIDGPAGTGKGTIAKLISKNFGFINVDTGAMFRCVTLSMLRQNVGVDELDKIQKILDEIQIDLSEENGEQVVILNGEDVTNYIRTKQINDIISDVSKIQIVRSKLLELQRNIAQGKNVVMEGRDIGTTVFPNADVKIYLDASPEERARRRVKQNEEKGITTSYEEVLLSVKNRDKIDSTREISPLKKAEDAILVDSTNMTIEEVEKCVNEIINQKYEGRA